MTPAVLQVLSAAAPAAASRQAAPVAPGDAPASFAAVLDGLVRTLAGDEQAESGVHASATIDVREEDGADAGVVQAGPEVTALAGDQPRLDALALMLAAAPAAAPAPAGHATPGAAAAGAVTAAAASDASTVAAQPRAAFDGTAAPMLRPMPAEARVAQPNEGHRARTAAAPPGPAGVDAPADVARSTPALRDPAEADAAADLARPAVAAVPGALRREGHAAPAQSRQVPAGAAADDANGADTAGHPHPTAAAVASARTASVVAGMQGAADAAPAAIGKALPPAVSAAPLGPAQQLSGDPGGEPAAPSASHAPDAGPAAAQEVSRTPPDGALPGPALAAAAAPAAPGTVAPGTVTHVAPPVGSPGWAPALAQQIVRLPGGGEVELHLNPAELGPLQVKLTLVESQAQVVFVAEHVAVRQALETALPQLRASFAESGISLGQATVGAGGGEQRAGQDGGERSGRGGRAAADDERVPAQPRGTAVRSVRTGAVDTFA